MRLGCGTVIGSSKSSKLYGCLSPKFAIKLCSTFGFFWNYTCELGLASTSTRHDCCTSTVWLDWLCPSHDGCASSCIIVVVIFAPLWLLAMSDSSNGLVAEDPGFDFCALWAVCESAPVFFRSRVRELLFPLLPDPDLMYKRASPALICPDSKLSRNGLRYGMQAVAMLRHCTTCLMITGGQNSNVSLVDLYACAALLTYTIWHTAAGMILVSLLAGSDAAKDASERRTLIDCRI